MLLHLVLFISILTNSAASRFDLAGGTLNVSVNMATPFCKFKVVDNKIIKLYSVDFELLKVLESRFNFKANLIDAHKNFGNLVDGQHWTGVFGHVTNQTSQMGMCGLSMTHDRYKFVQFSNIIYFGHITFLSKQPGLSSRQWIIFSPFTLNVWSLILILFIILAITIQSFSRFNSSNQSITFQDSLLQLVGIFLKQNIKRISCHASLRPFYACWLMFALVMSNAYGGRFYSMLALPKMEPPIDTIEEVVQLAMVDRIRITSYKSGSYLNDFLDARPETNNVYYQLGQNIRRTRPEMGKINKDFIDIVERSAIPTIFVSSRISLTFSNILYAHQPLHIASNHFKNDFYAIIFPKRSHLYRPFNRIILQSFEHGLIKHWTRNVYYQTPGALKNELAKINISQRIGALRLFDVYSILTFWILGNALAFFVFFLELASIVLN